MAAESSWESNAWVLALGDQLHAAVGERELIYLIENPILLEVPLSPYYCRQVVLWNGRLLPAMDLSAWLQGQRKNARDWKLAAVVAYQTAPGVTPNYGVLLLAGIPERLRVADTQACYLPKHPDGWRELALSCFRRGEDAIPILDIPHIFTGGLLTS
ncbi:MAG: chemotaxis protein CheW [Candidatus Competibacteraceae bacterium]|nr:chemotaxis protein CheW [Candidatus Competibacteraceae bacterium]MCP5132647.1 chemotaxis protein CheW [Gammaproteobacteria bacterium]